MNSFKKISLLSSVAATVLVLSSCEEILDILSTDDSEESTSVSASATETWTYDSDKPFYLVTSDVQSLAVTGDIAGKNLYLVQVNP